MFSKGFEKIAQMSPAKAIPFPHGIIDKAIKRYNNGVLAKHTGSRARSNTGKIKFVDLDSGLVDWLTKGKK